MGVPRMEHPAAARVRPVLDDLAHERNAEAAASVFVQDIDVCEVDEARADAVAGGGEADLSAVLVEADDMVARIDQVVLQLARPSFRPVRLAADIGVYRVAVDPRAIVVQLVSVAEIPPHALKVLRRKPPWYSYDDVITFSASRLARSPS